MINNDVLRRVRYILDLSDSKMMNIFAQANLSVSREKLSQWLKKDDDPDYEFCRDGEFASFLTGLIIDKRGKRDGEPGVKDLVITNKTRQRHIHDLAIIFKHEQIFFLSFL